MNNAQPNTSSTIKTSTLFSYFIPELITVGILYIGLEIINFRFIACTNVELCNATLFITNSLFHFITKVAEGFSIGLVIICGQYNGAQEYKKTGQVLADAFWTTTLVGAVVALSLYFGAHAIYAFYEVPQEIVHLGVPYLQIRSIGIFFAFVYFAIIGFLRGIKNPKIPMAFFILGAFVYLIVDYGLIFGTWGLPAMGLKGSAIASVIQFGVMLLAAFLYLLFSKDLRKYSIKLLKPTGFTNIKDLVHVSWPVMIDKASLALSPIWLNKMMGCTAKLSATAVGATMFDGLTLLKTMERVGILPALAFAQVITYVVSNDYKVSHFRVIKNNIKKVLFISCALAGLFTLLFCLYPHFFLAILNKQNAYSDLIAFTLPFIAVLVIFDVVQLILSAALRGAADVKTVMMTRLIVVGLVFIPMAYIIPLLPIKSPIIKFALLYSSAPLSKALMGLVYIIRFKSGFWKKQSIQD